MRTKRPSLCSVILVAACGGGSTTVPDSPDWGPSSGVRVTVTQAGQPVSALTVFFLEPDSLVAAMATTDAAGQASAPLHAGGSVTVVHAPLLSDAAVRDLDSWVAVQPGDDLALDLPVYRPAISLQVSAPATTMPGVASYRIVTPCGGTGLFHVGQSERLDLVPNCTASTQTTDFVAFALDASGHELAALVMPHVAVSQGQQLTLTGTYQPVLDVPIMYANAGGAQSMELSAYTVTADGRTLVANTSLHGTGGGLAGAFRWPAQLTTGTRALRSGPSGDLLTWGPISSTESLDLTARLGQQITSQVTIDEAHQQLAWTLAETGAPAQLAVASMSVDQGDGTNVAWTIVAPGAAPQLALPQLPSSLIQFPTPQPRSIDLSLLRVPGGAASWTQVLGPGGWFAGFAGLISASPSGTLSQVVPPGVPI